MNLELLSFGGILLHTSQGKFAVNGGGSLDVMERGYRLKEEPLRGLILTSEHIPRSRNATAFANRHDLPLLVTLATWAALGEHVEHPVLVSSPCTTVFRGLEVEFHFLRDDSIDPVYLIVRDRGKALGIVPDGKLARHTAEALRHCDTICLANRRNLLPGMPSALCRRIKSITNTPEEIDALFPDQVPIFG